jgi:hypothetical protein
MIQDRLVRERHKVGDLHIATPIERMGIAYHPT